MPPSRNPWLVTLKHPGREHPYLEDTPQANYLVAELPSFVQGGNLKLVVK